MRGSIKRRGKSSWRVKFDVARVNGERVTRYATVRGKRADAEAELVRLLNDAHKGTLVDPSKLTLGAWLKQWLDGKSLAARSRERYEDVAHRMLAPLGGIDLQKLKPLDVKRWLDGLTARDGRELGARTVRLAYTVLRSALDEAMRLDMLSRNVAASVTPPKIVVAEVEILNARQIADVLAALKGSRLYPIVSLALATGMRRGELLALRWPDPCLWSRTRSNRQSKGAFASKPRSRQRVVARSLSLRPPSPCSPNTGASG